MRSRNAKLFEGETESKVERRMRFIFARKITCRCSPFRVLLNQRGAVLVGLSATWLSVLAYVLMIVSHQVSDRLVNLIVTDLHGLDDDRNG
jgi:hypothetical protein